jgi:TRAP-type C4-dicarboxylate transport system permease small subunit
MRGYARLLDALGVGAGAVFALIALATTYDVALHNVAGSTVNGLVELVEYALFASTFLAAPWLLRHNGHVQIDFLVTALPQRLQPGVRRVGDAVGLAVCAVLFVYAVRVTHGAWQSGSLVLKTVIFPEWWLFAVIAVSMALLMAEFVRRLFARQVEPTGPKDF